MSGPVELTEAALRRKNIKTGLLVGAFALAVMITALIRFTVWGLPEDRETYEQQEQARSAASPPTEDRSDD